MKKLIVLMLLLFSVFSVYAETIEFKTAPEQTIEAVTCDVVTSVDFDIIKFDITGENKNNLVILETDLLSVMSIGFALDQFAYFSDSSMKKSNYIIHPTQFKKTSKKIDTIVLGGGQLSDFKRI